MNLTKTTGITIRYTRDERRTLMRAAKALRERLSTFIRRVALEAARKETP